MVPIGAAGGRDQLRHIVRKVVVQRLARQRRPPLRLEALALLLQGTKEGCIVVPRLTAPSAPLPPLLAGRTPDSTADDQPGTTER